MRAIKFITVFACVLAASACTTTGGAPTKGELRLAEEKMFFVGGVERTSTHPGVSNAGPVPAGTIVVNQMFVHARIPASPNRKTPIVLVHGGGLTGMSYETTPDGREGWSTYFVRQGFPTYVVDMPGRGRAGFDSTAVNKARILKVVDPLPANVLVVTSELAWPIFRIGPRLNEPYPGTQFPTQSFKEFAAQGVPYAEEFLEGGAMATGPAALGKLLEQIGPAVLVVHSLAGPVADALVESHQQYIRAVVNIEGAQNIIPTDSQIAAYREVPALELFGDFLDSPSRTGGPRFAVRKGVVDKINSAPGGRASIVALPDHGIKGNTHMMMMDRNSLEVASFIRKWLDGVVPD